MHNTLNTKYRVLGLMSGTSLDGLDIAQCTFEIINGKWDYLIERANTFSYTSDLKERLANAENLSGLDLMFLNNEFGRIMGQYVNEFLEGNNIAIDFIASHGQTIFHQPQHGLTLQIGSGACIAASTGLTTICDFRTLDVALGGQGAPLVPIGDKLLFADFGLCLNLGGFANISYDSLSGERLAYDICPVNIVINHLVRERNIPYDPEGSIARMGEIDNDLLGKLNNLDFYRQAGPKSLGKEWVLDKILPVINGCNISLEDKLRTFYEHVAIQVSSVVNKNPDGNLLITGGGAHNKFLIDLFYDRVCVKVVIPAVNAIDFKEALIFAFLGLLRYRNEVNCIRSVTGARTDNIGGIVWYSGQENLKFI